MEKMKKTPIKCARVSATSSTIWFAAKLLQAREEAKMSARATPGLVFLKLPKEASERLASRGMLSVFGTIGGAKFAATLEPDGKGGHWMRVEEKLRKAAGAAVGDEVELEVSPVAAGEEPEPEVPPDWKKALAGAVGPGGAKAREAWADITPAARRDWIQWMTSGKRAETRVKRVATACDMLAKGKRRPCCFDRSGMYGGSMGCPAAE